MKKLFIILPLLLALTPQLKGQEWIVPDDKKAKLSPFSFDESLRSRGEKLYSVNCMSCHGTPGKGNYLKLVPPPGDPATEKIQRNNDGEIFYKVSTGRGQMPSFKNVLSATDIWNLISFLRSFNANYKQVVLTVVKSTAYPGAEIKVTLSLNPNDSTIVLSALAINDNKTIPVTDAETKLLVHRTFGSLILDEPKSTDKKGVAIYKIQKNFPGDKDGNVRVTALFTNEEAFGSLNLDTMISAGTKTIPVSLVAERAMWNNVRKAPIWILLTFVLGLLAAWGTIFFVLLKLRDVFILGNFIKKEEQHSEKQDTTIS